MDALLNLLDTYGVALLFVVILLKEIGVPVPVPGDLLMIVAGARAAAGKLPIVWVLVAALVAAIVGAYVQYLLARGPGRSFIYRFGRYVGLTPARLDKAAEAIKGRGWVGVALGRALPGLRIGAVAACGLAAVPMSTFAAGLVAGSVLFVGFHTLLGFLAGPGVGAILDKASVPLLGVVVALADRAGRLAVAQVAARQGPSRRYSRAPNRLDRRLLPRLPRSRRPRPGQRSLPTPHQPIR